MRKSTKGAFAAATAGVLLLGGAGSLAYWTDTQSVPGGAITSGHIGLVTDATNTGCGGWTLDSGEAAAGTYADGDPLVPGDVLSKVCTYTISAEGNHLRATVEATGGDLTDTTGTLSDDIAVATTDLKINGTPATEFTQANNGQALTVTVTATFDSAATGNMDAASVLDDITVTATQVHD